MSKPAITVDHLSLRFGQEEALFGDLSLRIDQGELVAIIGPNGSGKTSLIKVLLGLLPPTSGTVSVSDTRIGYVPQHLGKDEFSPLTVSELFSLKLKNAGFWRPKRGQKTQIKQALERTRVAHVIDRQIKHLSGGELQRVMIAYALLDKPGLLILDEPISGIDVHGEQDFFGLIEDIHEKEGLTILMISHDIDVVYRYATQVICLNRQLVCQGVPSDVLTKETIEKTFSTKHSLYHHQHQAKRKKEL